MSVFKLEPHRPEYNKCLRRSYCVKCGLVYLRNRFSDWSIRMGCNSEDHPRYQHQRLNSGKNCE